MEMEQWMHRILLGSLTTGVNDYRVHWSYFRRKVKATQRLIISLFVLSFSTAVFGSTWYVDVDHPSGGNGIDWPNAFNDLSNALAVAEGNDIILVAEGIYKPSATGDRTASFEIPREVSVRGGYVGYDQPDPYLRDFRNFPTILSGDLGTTNSYHVVTTGNSGTPGEYAKLNGFHITGGVADGGDTNYHDRGGGVTVKGLTKIVNCYFYDNEAEEQGGAVNCDQPCQIINCIFINNRSDTNGGAVCLDESTGQSVVNCVFNNNYADIHGGAIYSTRYVNASVVECTFVNNESGGVGSAVYGNYGEQDTAVLALYGCIIWDNPQTNSSLVNQVSVSDTPPQHANVPVRLRNSTLQNLTNHYDGIWYNGVGNDASDPLFRDIDGPNNTAGDEDDDFRLSSNSPAIDSRLPSYSRRCRGRR